MHSMTLDSTITRPRCDAARIAQLARHPSFSPPGRDAERPVVCIVDDDVRARASAEALVCSAGWEVLTFSSAQEFLACPRAAVPRCLILDAALPDMDGLALQRSVAADHGETAIIFVTTREDVATVVEAMKCGAIGFFTKPFRDDLLLAAVAEAIEHSRSAHAHAAQTRALRQQYESLTRRERQAMALVVAGRLNKQIADELAISEITVKAHRGSMMRKMKARSLPDLVKMVVKLDPAALAMPGAPDASRRMAASAGA